MLGLIDAETLAGPSAYIWARGHRVLQGNRLGPDDAAHIAVLLGWMQPPPDALIADLGCGFGEPARLMREFRPDLRFLLVNHSREQLERVTAVPGMTPVLSDMHQTPIEDASVDGCTFLYSFCHSEPDAALREAARITRPGGFLFVYDYARRAGDNDRFERVLRARAYKTLEVGRMARRAGWGMEFDEPTGGDDALFRSLFDDQHEYDALFRDLAPHVWRFVRADDAEPA
jgi:SAM-dependent methyltransferase